MSRTTSSTSPNPAEGSPDARSRLMHAALETISEQGFGDSSVKAIAERAGVNHGLIHYHFGGKDELIFEALRQWNERSLAALAALRSTLQPQDCWQALWDLIRKQVKNEPARYRLGAQITALTVLPSYTLSARVRDEMAEWIGVFANLLVAQHGRKASPRDVALARAVNGAITAVALWAIRDAKADVDSALDVVEAMFLDAFAKAPARATRIRTSAAVRRAA